MQVKKNSSQVHFFRLTIGAQLTMTTTTFEEDEPVVLQELSSKSKKKKKSKAKKLAALELLNNNQQQQDDYSEDEEDLPILEDLNLYDNNQSQSLQQQQQQLQLQQHLQQHQLNLLNNQVNNLNNSPSDLLSTASDLYRQIEAAAASALSTHPSFASSFPPPPNSNNSSSNVNNGTTTTTDEAYWTSLPQHLRQFIRSALPLAAGLTSNNSNNQQNNQNLSGGVTSALERLGSIGVGVTTGLNGQPLPPLTHDQLSSAAAQLAQVVQSNWGQLGLGPIPTGISTTNNNRNVINSSSTTINLGSFPVNMPTREQMEAAIGSMTGVNNGSIGGLSGLSAELAMGMGLANAAANAVDGINNGDEELGYDLTEDEEDLKEGGENGGVTKKKNKKKKKKNAAAASAATVIPQQQQQQQAPVTITKSAIPAMPNLPVPVIQERPKQFARRTPILDANGKIKAPVASNQVPANQIQPTTNQAGKQPLQQRYYDPKALPMPGNYPPQQQQVQVQQQQQQVTPSIAPKAGPSSERERIRDFWLGLKEGERRALVKVEKEAVLRKMKEQQRSGCSCAVCGRKRLVLAYLADCVLKVES